MLIHFLILLYEVAQITWEGFMETKKDIKKCACCGKDMDMTDKGQYKVLMDCGLHRYVCSSECIVNYYKKE